MDDWEIAGWLSLASLIGLFGVAGLRALGRTIVEEWRRGERFPAYITGAAVWIIVSMLMITYGQGAFRW